MHTVLVLCETNPAFRKALEGIFAGHTVIFNESDDTSSIDKQTALSVTVIIGNPGRDFPARCPGLKWLQLGTAGADNFIHGEVPETVKLCCATGVYGHAISEFLVAQSLMLFKRFHLYRDEQAACRWRNRGMARSIRGAVVLVVGLGDIGGEYARLMKALGATVIGIRRGVYAKPDYLDELLCASQMESALPRADIVALALPQTAETIGLIGRPQLALMKKDAVLLNVGRGTAVDTEALCDALEAGLIAGAGLDVTDPEPLPPEHRLWKLENVFITPHVSGGRNMKETGEYAFELYLENARRFIRGEKLKSLVDYKTGYRIPEDK